MWQKKPFRYKPRPADLSNYSKQDDACLFMPFWESAGLRLVDLTGNYPGQLTGSGIGWLYNAVNRTSTSGLTRGNLFSITSSDLLSGFPTQEISVIALVRHNGSDAGTWQRIIDLSDSGNAGNGWALVHDATNNQLEFYKDGNSGVQFDLPRSIVDRWSFLHASVRSGRQELLLDGEVFYTDADSFSFSSATRNGAVLGWNHSATNRGFQGEIAALKVFPRFLMEDEHRQQIENIWYEFEYRVWVPVGGVAGAAITADQTETGDSQASALSTVVQVDVDQAEAGDGTAATLNNVIQLFSNQPDAGDTQSAAFVGTLTAAITADQTETGDSQASALSTVVQVDVDQAEAGDGTAATLNNVIQLFSNQPDAGDTQSAAFVGTLTAAITADQTETGDSQASALSTVVQVDVDQAEAGDGTAATLNNVIQLFSNQPDAGDTQSAAFVGTLTAAITADQTETGDSPTSALSTVVQVDVDQAEAGDGTAATLNNVIQLFSNQPDAGDTQSAAFSEQLISALTVDQMDDGDTLQGWIGLPPSGERFTVSVSQRRFIVTVAQRRFKVSA